MTRPPHPGETLACVMRERNVTIDDLVNVGLPQKWLSDLLRRLTEIDTKPPHVERTKLLAKATGLPVKHWLQAQARWTAYRIARERDLMQMRHRSHQK